MLATPTGSPWSTLLSAPPVYQAKFAGLLRRSAPTPCSSISSRKLLSLVSLLIYVPPIGKAFQLVSSSFSLLASPFWRVGGLVVGRYFRKSFWGVGCSAPDFSDNP